MQNEKYCTSGETLTCAEDKITEQAEFVTTCIEGCKKDTLMEPGSVVTLKGSNGKYCGSALRKIGCNLATHTATSGNFFVIDAGSGYIALKAATVKVPDHALQKNECIISDACKKVPDHALQKNECI